jgi:hypothetical protein
VTVREFLWNIRASAEGDMSYVRLIHFSIDCGLFSRIGISSEAVLSLNIGEKPGGMNMRPPCGRWIVQLVSRYTAHQGSEIK